MDCLSYTIKHIPPFIFKDTRVFSNPYTLDRDPYLYSSCVLFHGRNVSLCTCAVLPRGCIESSEVLGHFLP